LNVTVYDTTLRDGMQGEGMSLSVDEKALVAHALDDLGVHIIEAGFPASNPKEEALMLDPQGYVAEGTGENIFVVKNGVVRTPPTSAAILAGITRDTTIALLKENGVEVRQEMIARDELYIADEVFLTGTAAEVTPVREIDHRRVGRGEAGPLTRRIQESFFSVVKGADSKNDHWLTFV